ncbi:hypothetical protein [Haladaptatus caseinilyticus]|uniref:hypothetical protein n=1 Tax=Haladaptatus caseinilyticus TaxID=2993314 RepID=UPI00224B6983|nr:hypothetical protein [Haladaptatus caseinilyticus]
MEEVYEEYDTFPEMTTALDVDVTPQTVRRYMIDYGIHKPTSQSRPNLTRRLLELDPDSIPPLDGKNTSDENETSSNDSLQSPPRTISTTPVITNRDGQSSPKVDAACSRLLHSEMAATDDSEGCSSDRIQRSQDEPLLLDSVEHSSIEIPPHLTLEDIQTAVKKARTLYEAQQLLELDRDETRRLLQELDLLDFVYGRLATQGFEEYTIEDITFRIQNARRLKDDRTIGYDYG